jgi:CRP-like cAMP-binding protein
MVTEDSTVAEISNSHLFKSLEAEGREALLKDATTVAFDPGEVIVREGDPGDALYLIKKGTVRVHTTMGDNSVPLATLGRGACLGEVAVLSNSPRTATAVAEERCVLIRFSRQQIEDVLQQYPKVRKLLETVVMGRARDTIQKLGRNI